jgi:hypothetical protein
VHVYASVAELARLCGGGFARPTAAGNTGGTIGACAASALFTLGIIPAAGADAAGAERTRSGENTEAPPVELEELRIACGAEKGALEVAE